MTDQAVKQLTELLDQNTISNTESKEFQEALDDLEVITTLGTGTFGRVFLVMSKKTRIYYALKKLSKHLIAKLKQVDHLRSERRVLAQVKHPFVINMLKTFQDDFFVYILMDYVPGGELFSILRLNQKFPNDTARFYTAEIVLIFEYLHSHEIAYRGNLWTTSSDNQDLKPENILIGADGHIRLTDFGFAKKLQLGERSFSLCGTPDYLAPEILSGKGHSTAVDWWALGILIFEMLAGYPPFYDENPLTVYKKIVDAKISFPAFFTPAAKDLISKLLQTDLTKRFGNMRDGAKDVKNHEWFKGLDWSAVLKKRMMPPYIPELKGDGDTSNFVKYDEDEEDAKDELVKVATDVFSEF